MTTKFIIKCNELIDSNIILTCNQNWSQEDIALIVEQFFHQYPQCQWVESLEGADRVVARLLWQQNHFQLNFECYSESIWLDSEDEMAQMNIESFYAVLKGA
ncbi:hypothetical protein tinsulaeT_17540 [Thalassotalea insulae]|uniref:DUF3630 family protein n=1 Tax=Thalassotalea insulae TaxID=2056778 RepID=A0ABQ6GTD8_9GAMM|nr:DUF3630 family protein [Thalassotalea insulae]GLX78414.1 hypothetical protein tinsulaeT_17540 [Thalassotalea insulae]